MIVPRAPTVPAEPKKIFTVGIIVLRPSQVFDLEEWRDRTLGLRLGTSVTHQLAEVMLIGPEPPPPEPLVRLVEPREKGAKKVSPKATPPPPTLTPPRRVDTPRTYELQLYCACTEEALRAALDACLAQLNPPGPPNEQITLVLHESFRYVEVEAAK